MAITVIKKDKDENNIPYLMFESMAIEVTPYAEESTVEMWVVTSTPVNEQLESMGESLRYELPADEESFHRLLKRTTLL